MVKLSFSALLAESFGFFFANLRPFFHLVTIPWIASLAIRLVGSALSQESMLAVLVEKALDVVPTVMFMMAWQRLVLLGPNRVERLPGLGWSPRETAYLVHLLKIGGITFVLIAAFVLTVGTIDYSVLAPGAPVDPDLARRQALAAPLGAGFMVSALLALRVSYGLAATAVDVPFSPRLSWTYGRGNGWTIIGSLFVTFFVSAITTMLATLITLGFMRGALGAQEAAVVVTWTVALLVSYAGAAVAATVQANIFRTLLGWREGASLPATT
ncbi:hypothetical protein [Reyranella sp.]|uniref:hypothetical protein n=1 Tax=Reyranella sp. TaxID=1929291 RepID=UPI0027322417|nr:hypothetical protein [Reyranella sp.]MDP2373015.1 hypothetical protein [Reyranella sp.]